MSTMWTLIDVCFSDARKAQDLVSDAAARRQLRLRPDAALAEFGLGKPIERTRSTRPILVRVQRRAYATVEAAER
ncbi:MAG TPA: hypothetical protein VFV20_07800 [Candidatus Limnocylindria bacterium]|nr:hypothetical protein [Candidatus Limnocylindria bacterium]